MKVAIVRGAGLSKWEMQIYEPLMEWFEILGIGSKKPVHDCGEINFPIKKLWCPAQHFSLLPKLIPLCFQLFGDTQWLWGFEKAIQGVTLIHSVELRNGYTLQAIQAKKKGLVKAVTLTVYENIPFLGDQYQAREMIKQEVIPLVDHFLAASEQAKDALLVEGVAKERISMVPQGIDTTIFRPKAKTEEVALVSLRERLGIKREDFVILSVGRLVWEKGWYDLLRAAAKVTKESKKNIKFLIVGSGPEEKSLQDFIHRVNLSQTVILTGPLPYQDMPDVFRLANLFVHATLPTRYWNEQFGRVLIEAMAAALPIVGTLSGSTKETVGSYGGVFVAPGQFSSLANAILNLMKNPKLLQKIGLRNRQVAVEKYDVRVVAKDIKTIWEKVLANG